MSRTHTLFSTIASVAAFAALMGSPAAMAQTTTTTDSPSSALSTGEVIGEEMGDGSYIGNTHGDWELVCVENPDGEDPCQMYQLLRDGEGNATAEITLFPLPPGQEAAAGATILTPLETLLTAQLIMQVDEGSAKRYPFTFCTVVGCIARVGFTAEEVDAFRRGARAVWQVVPVGAPDQPIDLSMSLTGFTAAFNELSEQLP
ncbi:invasion associated locus B family protein [Roseinatronobacter sp. NSM]|uniref:invasion associated locus B family protein n=1 Tax=Roseinatronobacter sp. NSM TaxID=3457785 RepID=UPI004036DEFE